MTITVGPIQDGKQTLTIGDPIVGRYQTFISTPEKVDEFITTYDGISKKSAKRIFATGVTLPLAGLAIGALVKVKGVANSVKGSRALFGLGAGMVAGAVLATISSVSAIVKHAKLVENFIAENKQKVLLGKKE